MAEWGNHAVSMLDRNPPRQVNGQAIILRQAPAGHLEALLQLRSNNMPVMPGYIAAIGGCRDETDRDSRETTLREVEEETGLISSCISSGPAKFAEGGRCDWYVIVLENAKFKSVAKSRSECGNINHALPYLPRTAVPAECFGHAWVPVNDLGQIDEQSQPLMGGLLYRVQQAVQHLQRSWARTSTTPARAVQAPHNGWPRGYPASSHGHAVLALAGSQHAQAFPPGDFHNGSHYKQERSSLSKPAPDPELKYALDLSRTQYAQDCTQRGSQSGMFGHPHSDAVIVVSDSDS